MNTTILVIGAMFIILGLILGSSLSFIFWLTSISMALANLPILMDLGGAGLVVLGFVIKGKK